MNSKLKVQDRKTSVDSKHAPKQEVFASVPAELVTERSNSSVWLSQQEAYDACEHTVTEIMGRDSGPYFEKHGKQWTGFRFQPLGVDLPPMTISSGDAVDFGLAKVEGGQCKVMVNVFGVDVDPENGRRSIQF